jgi:3-hydroxy-9,10-secoandrosta-1,3,5(10)-triene-9,17-dione monooxygenase reductase component
VTLIDRPYSWAVSLDDGNSRIGQSDPFATPPEDRDPVRRLRGRLAAPVTVWTARDAAGTPAGITMSSVLVVEGEPPELLGLVDPLSAFWHAVEETGSFVVQVLASDHVSAAKKFALQIPVDPFEGESLTLTPWGPVLSQVTTWAGCTLIDSVSAGYALLVRASLDDITLSEVTARPLVHFRGTYFTAGPLRG